VPKNGGFEARDWTQARAKDNGNGGKHRCNRNLNVQLAGCQS